MEQKNKVKIRKELILIIGVLTIVFSISLVNATGIALLCMQKGQTAKFSLCNPTISDKYCSSTSCQICVNEISKGVYCPTNPNSCNIVVLDCTYLPTTSSQTNTTKSPFNISLISPANGLSTYNTTIKFTFNLTNSTNAASCNLLINGVAVASNSSKINSSTNAISKTLTSGIYSWSIKCLDKNGNSGTSLSRNFTILSYAPVVTLVNPQDNYNVIGPITIPFSYTTTNYNNIDSCSLFLNGNSVESNLTKITNMTNIINKTISAGVYTWFIKCTDKSGLSGTSISRNLVVLQNQTNSTQTTINQTNSNQPTNQTNNSTTTNSTVTNVILINPIGNDSSNIVPEPISNEEQNYYSGGGSYCITKWNCSEWNDCKEGTQTRTCGYPSNWCKPEVNKPDEKRNCLIILSDTTNKTQENNSRNLSIIPNGMDFSEEKSKGLFGITGAIIGIGKTNNLWASLIIISLVLIMFILSYYINIGKSKNYKKNNHHKKRSKH